MNHQMLINGPCVEIVTLPGGLDLAPGTAEKDSSDVMT